LFANLPQRSTRRGDSGVSEKNVDAAFLTLHCFVKAVEIGQVRDIALNGCYVLADFGYSRIQFALPAAGDKDIRSFGDELPGSRQADAAAASGYDCDFSFQLSRVVFLIRFLRQRA
jgi:hypothetical protein